MSTLKSKVRFIVPLTMWQRFVSHEILLKRPFEVKEFEETFYEYEPSDFISLEDYFNLVKKDIIGLPHTVGYDWDELEDAAYEYAKKLTFEDFKRIVFANYNENIYKLEKPITVDYTRYYHDDKDHHRTYEYLTAGDIWDKLFHWSLTNERPSVYFYDGDFEKDIIEIREYTRGDGVTKDVFVVREEEA